MPGGVKATGGQTGHSVGQRGHGPEGGALATGPPLSSLVQTYSFLAV